MKQKRKVKSLLPQRKDRKTSFLTTLLLVLSTILCIGSASLLTSSVFAENFTEVTYTGLDDNIEVLYEMKFVDPADLSGGEITKLEISGNSLYISPNPVIVNPDYNNVVASGTYGHILGGSGNKLSSGSENVTIIAGLKNEVKGANATLLGGVKNILGTGNVLVGGSDNKAQNNREGIVIIGGKDILVTLRSYIKDNIFILGGENSKVIRTGNNIILGGSGVNLSVVTAISTNTEMLNNIFAFSNPEEMKPQVGETFYLYLKNGVGIGTGGLPGGLVVHGAMSFGDGSDCNISNTGVVISYSGCLVGCTKSSYLSGKREVLDNSEKCKFLAETDSKLFYQEEEIPETPNYRGYCTYAGFTGHTRACSTPGVYQNVIFETSIVDNGGCASLGSGENKCVFECEKGYHLVHDTRYGGTGCYADCTTADGIKTIKHNESTIGYKKQLVICSDGEKCETCGGKNSTTLICDDGVLYISGTHTKAEENGYNYARCTLKGGYKCQSGNYNIENLFQVDPGVNNGQNFTLRHYGKIYQSSNRDYFRTEITFIRDLNKSAQSENTGFSQATSFNRGIITSEGARGYYQLCIDYTSGKNIDIKLNNTDCGKGKNYYKLIRCKSNFTNENGVCRPQCKSFLSGDNNYYNYGKILTGYKEGNVTCPKEDCESSAFRCEDGGERGGIWVAIDGDLMKNANNYKYSYCSVASKRCDQFELSSEDLERFKNRDLTGYENSIYTGCTIINNNNGNCETGSTYYKLDGCKTNYHTENNEYCIYNYRPAPCSDKVNLPYNAVRVQEDSTGRNGITLAPGEYGQTWEGEWNDKNAWDLEDIQPPEACKWKCVDGYHKEGTKCVKNQCTIPDDTWVLLEGSDENVPVKDMPCTLYPTKGEAGDNPCACICDYERNYFIENGACTRHSNVCGSKEYICISPLHEVNTGETASGYTWDCYLDDIEIDNCVICKDGYTKIDGVCVPNTADTVGKCGSRAFECLSGEPTEKVILPWKKGYTWECIGTKTSDECSFERNDCISYSAKCEKNNYNACNNFWYNNTYNASNKDDCISRGVGYNTDGTYHKAVSGDNSYVYFSPCFDWVETYPSCTFNGEVLTGDACFNIAIHGMSKLSLFPYEGCYRIDWTINKEYMPRDWGYIYNDSKEIIGSIEGSIDKTNLTRTGTSIEVHRPPQTGYMIREDNENLKNLTGKDLFIVANGDAFSQESLLFKFRINEWTRNTDYPPHFYEIKSWSRYGADEEKVAEDFVGSGIIVNPNGYIYVYEKGVFKKVATIPNYYTKMELEATIFHPICNTIDNDYSIANPNAGQRDCLPKIGDLLSGNVNFPRYNNRLLYIPGNGASWYRLQFDDSGIVTRMERRVYSMLIE